MRKWFSVGRENISMMDPPIKLFGHTIAFTSSASSPDDALDVAGTSNSGTWEQLCSSKDVVGNGAESGAGREPTRHERPSSRLHELSSSGSSRDDEEQPSSLPSEIVGIILPLSGVGSRVTKGKEDMDVEDLGLGNDHGSIGQEIEDEIGVKGVKMPRRPDKAVSCPRCQSLETKFCYYNNYNVNQPRHFCKHCQRYWTAGGTLRNVPVGAGRRKNKHATVIPPRQPSESGLVRSDAPDTARPLLVGKAVSVSLAMQISVVPSSPAGSLPSSSAKPRICVPSLSDPSDSAAPLPYSVIASIPETPHILSSPEAATSTNDEGLPGGKLPALASTGFCDVANNIKDIFGGCGWQWENETSRSVASETFASSQDGKGEHAAFPKTLQDSEFRVSWAGGGVGDTRGVHNEGPFGFFNGGWPYVYSWADSGPGLAAWNGAAGNMWAGLTWPIPGLPWSPTGWGPTLSIGPWAMSSANNGVFSPSLHSTAVASGYVCASTRAFSSSLGKHGRSSEVGGSNLEEAVWAPKSLRMADPEEALRSSVWRNLGQGALSDETTSSSTSKAFRPKTEIKKLHDDDQHPAQTSLHANPAAMSRSMYFHESN